MPRTTWSKWLLLGTEATRANADRVAKALKAKALRGGMEAQVRVSADKTRIGPLYRLSYRDRYNPKGGE